VLVPVEAATVDNHSTDGSTVTADPLGGRVDNDVGAMLNGTDIVATCTESVVDLGPSQLCPTKSVRSTYNKGDTVLMSDLCNTFKVRHNVIGVTHALDIDGTGLVIDGSGIIL
jgi:hypothetical protein